MKIKFDVFHPASPSKKAVNGTSVIGKLNQNIFEGVFGGVMGVKEYKKVKAYISALNLSIMLAL